METTYSLKHIACIMDGNRRWATAKGLPKMMGHTQGAETVKTIVKECVEKNIPYITFYALSTENIKGRSEAELNHLFSLIEKIDSYLPDLNTHQIQIRVIGDISALPQKSQNALFALQERTRSHTKLVVAFAINYGGRDEIVRAIKKIITNNIPLEKINEEVVAEHLDTIGIPDVDLLIRTGGDQRLSNYLPWQTTYAELYFTPTYWPDFEKSAFQKAINWFHEQKRNKGK